MPMRNWTPEEHEQMVLVSKALRNARESYVHPNGVEGMSVRHLANKTGYSNGFIYGIEQARMLPGRAAMTFLLDVLGIPADDFTRRRVLDACLDRSQRNDVVRRKMAEFYDDPSHLRLRTGLHKNEVVRAPEPEPEPEPAPNVVTASERRTAAVDKILYAAIDLTDVEYADVIDWLEKNGSTLEDDQRAAIMRAVWSS